MAFEVLSIKIYTPHLGASIYVWTSILTITLAGLAAGYWSGWILSKKNSKKALCISFIASGILIFTSTFIANMLLPAFMDLEIRLASIFSAFLILFFPMFFLGTISPLIVKFLNSFYAHLGRSAGLIYATGTVGGVFFVLITVYAFIPFLGVRFTSFLLGTMLLLVGAIITFYKLPLPNEKK